MGSLPNRRVAMPDMSRRSDEAEWLDTADASSDQLEPVLHDLARFNRIMLGHRPVFTWLRHAIKERGRDTGITLLDVGCGHGDLLRAIRRWARKGGVPIRLIGVDLNRETIRIARMATDIDDEIDYLAMDIFDRQLPMPVDYVVSSLVTHHMPDEQIVRFMRWMECTARAGWMIYDLQRHPVPYHFIGLMRWLTRLHPMVIHDGQISVARSLTRTEWLARLREAEVPREAVHVRWFLFRFVIGRMR